MTDWNNNSQTSERIIVHENTHEPSEAWKKIKNSLVKKHVQPLAFDTPMSDDKVRFVCISDTHGKTDKLKIPKADVLLHAGDFTMHGWPDEIAKFNRFLATLDIKHKVVIAGNHEHTFESDGKTRDMLNNCVYLQESSVELFGIKIYGAPW
jgi:predicted phosphohydrolase